MKKGYLGGGTWKVSGGGWQGVCFIMDQQSVHLFYVAFFICVVLTIKNIFKIKTNKQKVLLIMWRKKTLCIVVGEADWCSHCGNGLSEFSCISEKFALSEKQS